MKDDDIVAIISFNNSLFFILPFTKNTINNKYNKVCSLVIISCGINMLFYLLTIVNNF